ncbi:TetR/AcrR family transcriptional regulator [Pseudonocardia ailaonensis]|uniref:TetR/AcrR family transcriptional regulator n=1 Tax=Pseudonocardia ailaonensis TaxID=367279 RepID=UPI0031D08511
MPPDLGDRAARTRQMIIESCRELFLTRGYAGTRINNITDACGISRAGFYTYFRDKREVFNLLGQAVHDESMAVLSEWNDLPRPCSVEDVSAWVQRYFAFLDRHGGFVLSSHSTPDDPDLQPTVVRHTMRAFFILGVGLRSHQATPTTEPELLGMMVKSALDRTWQQMMIPGLPLEQGDIVDATARMIMAMLREPG